MRPLLLAVMVLLGAPAAAQTSAPAQPDEPQANPGRPTVSTPATLTPVGYLQFENGVLFASHSPDVSSQQSVNQVTKLAVSRRLQVFAQFEPVARTQDVRGGVAAQPGGIGLGAQAVLFDGGDRHPTVAVSYARSVYGGTAADLDVGSTRQAVTLLVSADGGGVHVDANAIVGQQVDDQSRGHAQFGQTLSISRSVGAVTIAGELWHFTQPLRQGQCAGNLWAVSYAVNRTLVLDAGFNRGLTATSTRWEFFGGFTYLLPHRL